MCAGVGHAQQSAQDGRCGGGLQGDRRLTAYGWALVEPSRFSEAPAEFTAAERNGHWRESLHVLEEATYLAPDDPVIQGALALTAVQLGRASDAVRYWGRALELQPGYFTTHPEERARYQRVATRTPSQ